MSSLSPSFSWREISNDEGTGKLDRAIQSGEKEEIPAMLADFLPMNQEFLEIAADRFSEMVIGTGKPELAL